MNKQTENENRNESALEDEKTTAEHIKSEGTSKEQSDNNNKLVKDLEQQVATLKDTLLRKLAESENLRKRLEKEKNDAEKYANGKFAKDLLGVLDNFERVTKNLATVEEKVKDDVALRSFFDGVAICGKELLAIFKKHGITQVEVSEGTHFDPNFHQAMCEIESTDHEPGAVIHVMQSGYIYNDRLLRPAMVSVAKKKEGE